MTFIDLVMAILIYSGFIVGLAIGLHHGFKGALLGSLIGLFVGYVAGIVLAMAQLSLDACRMWIDQVRSRRAERRAGKDESGHDH